MPRERQRRQQIEDDTLGNRGDILEHADILSILQAARVTLMDWRASAITIMDAHTDRIESLESSRTQAAALLSDHGGRIGALETWRTAVTAIGLPGRVTTLENGLAALSARVEALESA